MIHGIHHHTLQYCNMQGYRLYHLSVGISVKVFNSDLKNVAFGKQKILKKQLGIDSLELFITHISMGTALVKKCP